MTSNMARFDAMVAAFGRAQDEAERRAAEQRLWQAFGRDCAVFVSDMSGFSRLTKRHSIVHFLAMIQQCRQLLLPMITEGGGSPIKTPADNIYAIFTEPEQAIHTSIALQRALRRYNVDHPPECQLGLGVGIGYGSILVIDNEDFFGDELNLAFKLGEDTAEAGEILVTHAAFSRGAASQFHHEERHVALSGISIDHVSIQYD